MNSPHGEGLDLGLEEMERQHGELDGILEALRNRAGQARPMADLERLLLLFEEHVEGHFRAEEALMRRFAYDNEAFRHHCGEHREILRGVRELLPLLRQQGVGSPELESLVERRIIQGLENHMKWDDAVVASLRAGVSA